MKRLFTLSFLLLFVLSYSQTGTPVIEWEKAYGGSSHEYFSTILLSSDGGYLLSGRSESNDGDIQSGNIGSYDFWIVKIDNQGTIQWEKTYGGSGYDLIYSTIQTSDGGYLLSGNIVVKIDNQGTIQWEKTYGGYTESSIQTSDGGYLLSGNTGYSGILSETTNSDSRVLKVDNQGTIQWEQTYGGSKGETINSSIQTSDGGYILEGFTYSSDEDVQSGNKGGNDLWVVKIDNLGNIQWEQTYGGSLDEIDPYIPLSSILNSPDGGYIIGGNTWSSDGDIQSGPHGESDIWIIKTDNQGNIEWEKTYGGSKYDIFGSIQPTTDGGYIIGGSTNSYDGDISTEDYYLGRYWVFKIDDTGNIQWSKTIDTDDSSILRSLQITSDEGCILGGESYYNGGNHGENDYRIVKIGMETTGLEEYFNENVKIYPNPITENSFTIETPFNHSVQLHLIDIHGRTILSKYLHQTSNKVSLEIIPDGLYFIQLIDEDKVVHQQKIIKRN